MKLLPIMPSAEELEEMFASTTLEVQEKHVGDIVTMVGGEIVHVAYADKEK